MTTAPDLEMLLLDYASGALAEGPALAVAAKLALDPTAQARFHTLEAAGGVMFEGIAPVPVSDRLIDATLARLGTEPVTPEAPVIPPDAETRRLLPPPLWRYVPGGMASLRWKRWGKSIEEAVLPIGDPNHRATLLRIKAGGGVLNHTHTGTEYTVVLSGRFHDETGTYGPGALQVCDGSVDHMPVADIAEDCLCLGVLSAPIRMTGLVGRLMNPLLKF